MVYCLISFEAVTVFCGIAPQGTPPFGCVLAQNVFVFIIICLVIVEVACTNNLTTFMNNLTNLNANNDKKQNIQIYNNKSIS